MAIRKGTKAYSEYFGNGVVDEIKDSNTMLVKFSGALPKSSYKRWCSIVIELLDGIISYNEDLWYYKDEDSGGHTPNHQLKVINPKIKTIKE